MSPRFQVHCDILSTLSSCTVDEIDDEFEISLFFSEGILESGTVGSNDLLVINFGSFSFRFKIVDNLLNHYVFHFLFLM